jgi:spore coat polysaccharide biosynthesis protein SpsF
MIVASIQARLGSKRLPRKALADIAGAPALARLIRRLKRAKSLDAIVLATPDQELADLAKAEGIHAFIGPEDDVLTRLVGAHKMMNTDIVVQCWGDSPFVDPEVVDMAVLAFQMNDADVVTDTRRKAFPQGVGVSVFSRVALEVIDLFSSSPSHREHAGLYFYECGTYRILHLAPSPRWHRPDVRLLLDYPEDLEFIRAVAENLVPHHGDDFGLDEILEFVDDNPGLHPGLDP